MKQLTAIVSALVVTIGGGAAAMQRRGIDELADSHAVQVAVLQTKLEALDARLARIERALEALER